MSLQKKCQSRRIPRAKAVLNAINKDIENNLYCISKNLNVPNQTVSSMELNLAKLPGIFCFNTRVAVKRVEAKFYTIDEKGYYHEEFISEAQEQQIRKKHDGLMVKVHALNGRLGDSDFEYFEYIEKFVYDFAMNNIDSLLDRRNEPIYLGTYNDIAKKVKNLKSVGGSNYDAIEAFLHRLTGLVITYYGKAKYIDTYMENNEKRETKKGGGYMPFRNFTCTGEIDGNKGITLEVDATYLSNVVNGHSKLIYNQLNKGIKNSNSKYLFRYLTLSDQKAMVPTKYSELTQLMGIVRHKNKAKIMNQIGSIARGINNDNHGDLLVYVTQNDNLMFGKNFPFIMKPMKDKKDWQILFFLNVYITPDMHNYGVQSISRSIVETRLSQLHEIYEAFCSIAEMHGLSLHEYIHKGLNAVALTRAYGLTESELSDIKKHAHDDKLKLKAKMQKRAILGAEAEKLYNGFDPAMKIISDAKALKLQNAAIIKGQNEADDYVLLQEKMTNQKNKVGRPNTIDSDIPF
jgi:hypothetical protein